jgi:surfeit locus 1 family protein
MTPGSTINQEGRKEAGRRFPWLVAALALAAFAVLISLGTWQVQRLQWKEALIATIAERTQSEPRPLGEIEQLFASSGDIEYFPVSATGEYLHEAERHFFATWQGQAGYFVYTPLRLADGRAVFVNRGFVPFDRKNPETRREGQVAGPQTVTGLARNPLDEKPSSMLPDNDPEKNIFYWKDRDAFAASAGLSGVELVPFFIDADDAPNPGGLPVGGVTIIDMPNNHLQYAVTWYGLALALVAVFAAWFWRQGSV